MSHIYIYENITEFFNIVFFLFFIMSELGSMLRLLGPKLCRHNVFNPRPDSPN